MDKILQMLLTFIGLGHYSFLQNLAAVIQLNHYQFVSCSPHNPRQRCKRDQNIMLTGGMGRRRERSLDPSRCNFKLWNSTVLNIAWKQNHLQPDFLKEIAAPRQEKILNTMRPKIGKKPISRKKKKFTLSTKDLTDNILYWLMVTNTMMKKVFCRTKMSLANKV